MIHNYNYKKIFFRRPFFTRNNQRFLLIVVTVAIFCLLIVIESMRWACNLPLQLISQKIKTDYVLFLINEKHKILENNSTISKSLLDPHFHWLNSPNKKPSENLKKNSSYLEKVSFSHSALKDMAEKKVSPEAYFNHLFRPETGSIEAITTAVRDVPGMISPLEDIYRLERKLTFREDDKIVNQIHKSINIPVPPPAHIASDNGNRDPEETFAIMESNEYDIQYCFEKYSRYDPNFSGNVLVSFTIHPFGYVIPSSIKILNSNITDPRIIRCIKKSIQRWRNFPRLALENGEFTVKRKYIF